MLDFSALVVTERSFGVAFGVDDLRVVELLRLDDGHLVIEVDSPLLNFWVLLKLVNEFEDSSVSLVRSGQFVVLQLSHLH